MIFDIFVSLLEQNSTIFMKNFVLHFQASMFQNKIN